MRQPSIKYAAITYLNFWLATDRRLHAAVNGGDRNAKLAALSEAAVLFRIARNFHSAHDEGIGLARYEPVLNVIDTLQAEQFSEDLADAVLEVRDKLSKLYGGRNLVSATTKFLWLKLLSPIIIYDKQARVAIGTRDGDLHSFYDAWLERFDSHREAIALASQSLVELGEYTIDPTRAKPDYISSLVHNEWFQHRVFDIHLWHIGSDR